MDILIAFILLVIAVGLFTRRPLQININHNHKFEYPEPKLVPNPDYDPDAPIATMGQVITAINEVMLGGDLLERPANDLTGDTQV